MLNIRVSPNSAWLQKRSQYREPEVTHFPSPLKYPRNIHRTGMNVEQLPAENKREERKLNSPNPALWYSSETNPNRRSCQYRGNINAPMFVLRSWYCKCYCKASKHEQMWRMDTKVVKKKKKKGFSPKKIEEFGLFTPAKLDLGRKVPSTSKLGRYLSSWSKKLCCQKRKQTQTVHK